MKMALDKLYWKYGLVLGFVTSIWIGMDFFIVKELGRPDLGNYTGAFAIIILIIVIMSALKNQKKSGQFSFLHIVKLGALIGLIGGFIAALFLFIYLTLNPESMSSYFMYVAETMRATGESQQAIDEAVQNLASLNNPQMQALMMFIGSIVSSIALSIIFWIFKL